MSVYQEVIIYAIVFAVSSFLLMWIKVFSNKGRIDALRSLAVSLNKEINMFGNELTATREALDMLEVKIDLIHNNFEKEKKDVDNMFEQCRKTMGFMEANKHSENRQLDKEKGQIYTRLNSVESKASEVKGLVDSLIKLHESSMQKVENFKAETMREILISVADSLIKDVDTKSDREILIDQYREMEREYNAEKTRCSNQDDDQ